MEGQVRAAEGALDTDLDLCKGALGAWALGWGPQTRAEAGKAWPLTCPVWDSPGGQWG